MVVNICSVSSYVDLPLSAVYCASKAALLSVTNCLRMEVQPLGVHVMGEPCRGMHLASVQESHTEACMHVVRIPGGVVGLWSLVDRHSGQHCLC